ncbi:anaerobic glycerol-3-phosphate dehydrogenase subunit C [bacterium]|nr:anaerobic glycerol-3-phosphate dehydrogenase subunit C [candidate division CSSED10-310 bacterium]
MKIPDRRKTRQLRSALKSRLSGEAYFDDQTRLQYSTAACMYRVFPSAVVMPRDGDDVSETVRIARDLGIPVTARGAGVGLTGGCLGNGIIVDFSRHMNRILSIDVSEQRVIVEPGVVQNDLDRALRKHGLFFPPDPSSHMYSTIGGMVGNNAAGPHSIKYGATRDYVLSVSAICGDGEEVTFENSMRWVELPDGRVRRLAESLHRILTPNESIIQTYLPKTRKNSSGYRIDGIVEGDCLHMARLMAASEGTLGVFTGLELAIRPIPGAAGMILLMFDSVQASCEAVPMLAAMNPSMLEIMESTFIELVRQSAFDVGVPFPRNLQSLLLVEFDGDSADEVSDRIQAVERMFIGPGRLAIGSRRGIQAAERARLDRVRRAASPILNRYPAPYKPIKFIEDTAVPVDFLPQYIRELHQMFKKFSLRGVIYGHAGDGHIHVNPLFDMNDSDLIRKMHGIAEHTNDLIRDFRGTLSGEHGDGLLRTPFLPDFFGPAFPIFQSVKALFDPESLLNPGKIIQTEPRSFTDNIKLNDHRRIRYTESMLDIGDVTNNLFKCSNCGACRQYCPVFIATIDERTTPRSKANLLTRIISGEFPSENEVVSPDHRQVFDFCIQCGTCLTECPSGVDIPRLMQLAKHVSNDHNGLSLKDRLIAETGLTVSMGRILPTMSNSVLNNPIFRKALEMSLGLAAERDLAPFEDVDLSSIAHDISFGGGQTIVYFPGCTAIANDPWGEGAATLSLLAHHGYAPYIPDLKCCGIASISMGLLESVRPQAEANVRLLHEITRGGTLVVCSSPSCGLALRHEYPQLLDTVESREVASRVRDIHEFFVELLSNGRLDSRFQPNEIRVAVQQPCHARAAGIGEYPIRLLEMIPGMKVHRLEPRCCGIAGTYGMKKKNYEFSFKIGERLFREIRMVNPDLVVSACGTCRIQIEAATGFKTIHPASLLAEAYGLLPAKPGILKHS